VTSHLGIQECQTVLKSEEIVQVQPLEAPENNVILILPHKPDNLGQVLNNSSVELEMCMAKVVGVTALVVHIVIGHEVDFVKIEDSIKYKDYLAIERLESQLSSILKFRQSRGTNVSASSSQPKSDPIHGYYALPYAIYY
jgi:hypothetical protein